MSGDPWVKLDAEQGWRGRMDPDAAPLWPRLREWFELDGRVFLDHNSFNTSESREYMRRIRFRQAARVFTFNPLQELGIVA